MTDLDHLTRARLRTPLTADQLAAIEGRGTDEGGQIHQDNKALLAEIDRLKVELADTGDCLGLTQRRLNELHQGEENHPDHSVIATPAQWIWRWNRSTPKRRLEVAASVQRAWDDHDRTERALRSLRVQADIGFPIRDPETGTSLLPEHLRTALRLIESARRQEPLVIGDAAQEQADA
jgi:hypothetical protein